MKLKRVALISFVFLFAGCTIEFTERAPLPPDEFLIIAHRGASSYLPEHTIPAYELAVEMGADYIELDLHMTKDKKLVALHDSKIRINGKKQAIAQLTLDEIENFSPGAIFNELYPELASPTYEAYSVPELSEVLSHFETDVNYYIEIKSPTVTPGIEEELIYQLQMHDLLNRSDDLPKVIIQSYNADSLKKIYELNSSIPLVKLYSQKTKHISDKEIDRLLAYASAIGVNEKLVSKELITRLHENELHIHPFVLNEEESMQNAIELGVDGFFTDKPDIAVNMRHLLKTQHGK